MPGRGAMFLTGSAFSFILETVPAINKTEKRIEAMKKNVKVLALLLAVAMLLALSACGAAKPSVVGKWQAEIDMRAQMIEEMDNSIGGLSFSFGDYLDSYVWVLTMELTKDGRYTLSYDINSGAEGFKAAVVAYMRDAICELAGAEVGDDVITEALGMPLEDYAQMVLDSMNDAAGAESGSYKDKDGKLIWENGEESPYVLSGDTLSFSVQSLGSLRFTRVG